MLEGSRNGSRTLFGHDHPCSSYAAVQPSER